MLHKLRRAQLWGSWCLLWFLIAFLWVIHARAQADLERRVQDQEAIHADRRLSVIETRLDSIEFLGRGILIAVCGQLALQGLNLRGRRER